MTDSDTPTLADDVPVSCYDLLHAHENELRADLPALARNETAMNTVEAALMNLDTRHGITRGDARQMDHLDDESVELVVTSPPYFDIKEYGTDATVGGQLANSDDYTAFLASLTEVWEECFRALVPGGRMCVVVGDVLRSRSKTGHHHVLPLHASIIDQCQTIGFSVLAPIIWQKIGNATTEGGENARFLGKPYEPGAVIKNDIEYILLFRKPGGYRSPSRAQRILSLLRASRHQKFFTQVWNDIPGDPQDDTDHPAPYPVELAQRLIRMFSFAGDTVLDPFAGTGTTAVAASQIGRHSENVELVESYAREIDARLEMESQTLLNYGGTEISSNL